ncbi:hypothetical protein [Treponema denticola]|jgi:hypothetical protein|uniref:Uncharacterized protein n=2 Tax=Treponema denticola TaxID=158 RepID=A0A0F6MPA5_TREDN|nr:hypothetical protein [Treponema denticola]EGC76994.1 hypothetical protein HMPREF9353_01342 [Treponema denticola F0402]EMB20850.1 hypothetical protein HMPREF9723_02310 [Treponema denticola OTK]EMB35850.1 hypothetical protein HMPREF9726_00042 [Treponema denticola H-22]EMB46355.1 hypothetical protein HMPREF9730_00536 [Treponema denticola AL-2]UTC85444.1 hypothetical protein E4N91_07310 [Treponema denticola]
MKKKFFAISIMALLALAVFAQNAANVTTKTQKIEVKDRPSAVMYLTKMDVPGLENQVEFYLTYEENNDTYNEADCEKFIMEFIAEYKRTNVFSKFEVEDLKAASVGKTKTTVVKRVIFRKVR